MPFNTNYKRGTNLFYSQSGREHSRNRCNVAATDPDARIAIGHGQMEGNRLEKALIGFMEGQSDILIATTIIENGLDVPNANTIFINNANSFGLSDLHQIERRVGRSNKKAFCYFITPPMSAMASDAKKESTPLHNSQS